MTTKTEPTVASEPTTFFGDREAALALVLVPVAFLVGAAIVAYDVLVRGMAGAGAGVTTLGAIGWTVVGLGSGTLFALGATYVFYRLSDRTDGFVAVVGIVFVWIFATASAFIAMLNQLVPRHAASGRLVDDPVRQEFAVAVVFLLEETLSVFVLLTGGPAVLLLALVLARTATIGRLPKAAGYLLGVGSLLLAGYQLVGPALPEYGPQQGLAVPLIVLTYLWIGAVGVLLVKAGGLPGSPNPQDSPDLPDTESDSRNVQPEVREDDG